MSIITWVGDRVLHPGNVIANPLPDPEFFDYNLEIDKISFRCPECLDFVEFAKDAKCRCGKTTIKKLRGDLWVQFSSESGPPQYVALRKKKKKWWTFFK